MPSRPTSQPNTAPGAARAAARPVPPSAAAAKSAAKEPARSSKAMPAKGATRAAAKAPAKAAAKGAAKTPAKSAAKAPPKTAAKAPAAKRASKPTAKTPTKTPAARQVAPNATGELVLRDDAQALGGVSPAAVDETLDSGGYAPEVQPAAAGPSVVEAPEEAEAELPLEPSAPEPEPVPEDLSPEEWFRREKSRRTRPATADVMAEARALLLQAVAEAGPRRGRPVRVGAAAKGKPTKKLAPDEFELEEYRPGEKKAPGET